MLSLRRRKFVSFCFFYGADFQLKVFVFVELYLNYVEYKVVGFELTEKRMLGLGG